MQIIQESIIEKTKEFISKYKGKLAAAAGLAAVGYLGYKLGHSNGTNNTNTNTHSFFGSSKIINTDDDF